MCQYLVTLNSVHKMRRTCFPLICSYWGEWNSKNDMIYLCIHRAAEKSVVLNQNVLNILGNHSRIYCDWSGPFFRPNNCKLLRIPVSIHGSLPSSQTLREFRLLCCESHDSSSPDQIVPPLAPGIVLLSPLFKHLGRV